MNITRRLISLLVGGLLASGFASIASAHDVKVLKLTGAAEVQLPGDSRVKNVSVDMVIPEGATIKTAPKARLAVEIYPGAVATITGGTTVTVENLAVEESEGKVTSQSALLALKEGTVISEIDPKKKGVDHYGVRTPRGVASANGTVFAVTVDITGTTVATMEGTVTLDLGNGVMIDIPVGTAAIGNSDTAVALQAAINASGQTGLTVAELLSEMVQVVADNVAAGTSAVSDAQTAAGVLAAVVGAASAAQPNEAGNFTSIAAGAAQATGNTAAIAAIVQAATQAAPNAAAAIAEAAGTTPAAAAGTASISSGTTPLTPVDPNTVSNSGG